MKSERRFANFFKRFLKYFVLLLILFIASVIFAVIAWKSPGLEPTQILKYYEEAVLSENGDRSKLDDISRRNVKKLEEAGYERNLKLLRTISYARYCIEKGDESQKIRGQFGPDFYYELAIKDLERISPSIYGDINDICQKLHTSPAFNTYRQQHDIEMEAKRNTRITKPYVGMPVSEISSTELGKYSTKKEDPIDKYGHIKGTITRYEWIDNHGHYIFTATSCGETILSVIDRTDLYPPQPDNTPSPSPARKNSGSSTKKSSSSKKKTSNNSIVSGYYSAEDFYYDYYDDFFDFEEAEEYYYEHGGF